MLEQDDVRELDLAALLPALTRQFGEDAASEAITRALEAQAEGRVVDVHWLNRVASRIKMDEWRRGPGAREQAWDMTRLPASRQRVEPEALDRAIAREELRAQHPLAIAQGMGHVLTSNGRKVLHRARKGGR